MENNFENTPKSLFTSKEQYLQFVEAFKKASKEKNLTTEHFMLYAILRNKDWRKGFATITNHNKLTCSGMKPNGTLHHYLMVMRSRCQDAKNMEVMKEGWAKELAKKINSDLVRPFGGFITLQMLEKLIVYLPVWDGKGEKIPELCYSPFLGVNHGA